MHIRKISPVMPPSIVQNSLHKREQEARKSTKAGERRYSGEIS